MARARQTTITKTYEGDVGESNDTFMGVLSQLGMVGLLIFIAFIAYSCM